MIFDEFNTELKHPYQIGVFFGVATALLALGISLSYCSFSTDEMFYSGLIVAALGCIFTTYSVIKKKQENTNV